MTALNDDLGGKFDILVEAQRGMTPTETWWFLTTGKPPRLDLPPAESDDLILMEYEDSNTSDEMGRRILGGNVVSPGSPFFRPTQSHGEITHSETGLIATTVNKVQAGPNFEIPRSSLTPETTTADSQPTALVAADWDPSDHPRDSQGRFAEKPGGDLPNLKSIKPAAIYKNHAHGTVVARSASGDRRLRWNGDKKKYDLERRDGDTWAVESQLNKTSAYNELKTPGKWVEPTGSSNTPTVSSQAPVSPSKKLGKIPNDVQLMNPSDKDKILAEVIGDDVRAEMMRGAIEDADPNGQFSKTYIARNQSGKLTGALSIKDLDAEAAEEQGYSTPYSYVEFVGATPESGAGTDLVRQAIKHALDVGSDVLHLQATEESYPYWEKQGFKIDPLDVGVDLYGLDRKQMQQWLDKNESGQTVSKPSLASTDTTIQSDTAVDPAATTPNGLDNTKKPLGAATKVVFRTDIADGEVIAVSKNDDQRLRWNAGTKKFDHETRGVNGQWETTESLNKGKTYQLVKGGDWYEPTSQDFSQTSLNPEPPSLVTSVEDVGEPDELTTSNNDVDEVDVPTTLTLEATDAPLSSYDDYVSKMKNSYYGGFTVENSFTTGNVADAVDLIKLSDGTLAVSKIDKTPDKSRREVLAGAIANAIGVQDYGVAQLADNHVLMSYVPGKTSARLLNDAIKDNYYINDEGFRKKKKDVTDSELWKELVAEQVQMPGAREIGILDWLISNRDRHERNWMVNDNTVKPIDHGNADFKVFKYTNDKGKVKVLTTDSPFAREWVGVSLDKFGALRNIKPKVTKSELEPIGEKLRALESQFTSNEEREWFTDVMSQFDLLYKKAPK